jgi:hypothetical protein
MPIMPRMDDKDRKIAYKILGTPENLQENKKAKQKKSKVQERLTFEETVRVR